MVDLLDPECTDDLQVYTKQGLNNIIAGSDGVCFILDHAMSIGHSRSSRTLSPRTVNPEVEPG